MIRILKLLFNAGALVLLCLLGGCSENNISEEKIIIKNSETKYDSTLALQLGADDYGMAQYVMAFLKKGPNRTPDAEAAAALQKAHLDNITRLANEGKLVLAGPFMDDGDIRGIYIFKVKTIEEAQELTATDPAIIAGSLVMELHPWYGTAALPMLNEWYPKLAKKSI